MASIVSTCLAIMTHCVTKAMLIHIIDGKCHIQKLKGKTCKSCLTKHTRSISCHWLLMHSGVETYTYQHHRQKRFKETSCVPTAGQYSPSRKIMHSRLSYSWLFTWKFFTKLSKVSWGKNVNRRIIRKVHYGTYNDYIYMCYCWYQISLWNISK